MERITMSRQEHADMPSRENASSFNTRGDSMDEHHIPSNNIVIVTVSDSLKNKHGDLSNLDRLDSNEEEAQKKKSTKRSTVYAVIFGIAVFLLVGVLMFCTYRYFNDETTKAIYDEQVMGEARMKREIGEKGNKNTKSFIFSRPPFRKHLKTPPTTTTTSSPTEPTEPIIPGFIGSRGK